MSLVHVVCKSQCVSVTQSPGHCTCTQWVWHTFVCRTWYTVGLVHFCMSYWYTVGLVHFCMSYLVHSGSGTLLYVVLGTQWVWYTFLCRTGSQWVWYTFVCPCLTCVTVALNPRDSKHGRISYTFLYLHDSQRNRNSEPMKPLTRYCYTAGLIHLCMSTSHTHWIWYTSLCIRNSEPTKPLTRYCYTAGLIHFCMSTSHTHWIWYTSLCVSVTLNPRNL